MKLRSAREGQRWCSLWVELRGRTAIWRNASTSFNRYALRFTGYVKFCDVTLNRGNNIISYFFVSDVHSD